MNENKVWSKLIAAVEYVAAIARPDLTVTGALDEALRWWIAEHLDPVDSFAPEIARPLPWDDLDPLRTTLDRLLMSIPAAGLPGGHRIDETIESAISSWVSTIANGFNDGHVFA